jgi:hypothetical protein
MRPTAAIRRFCALSVACLVLACGTGHRGPPPVGAFDFVYGSATHIPPTEGVLRTTASPERALAVVEDELRRASATEMTRVDALAVSVSSEEDLRWQSRNRIAKEEWAAYARRDRRALDAIERPEGLGSGPLEDPRLRAVRLTARVWERDAVFERTTVETTEYRSRTTGRTVRTDTDTRTLVTSDPMASELSFLVWRGADRVTNVYVTATPIINEFRPSENPTLALKWLPFARGYDEAQLVREYQKILRRRLPPAT